VAVLFLSKLKKAAAAGQEEEEAKFRGKQLSESRVDEKSTHLCLWTQHSLVMLARIQEIKGRRISVDTQRNLVESHYLQCFWF